MFPVPLKHGDRIRILVLFPLIVYLWRFWNAGLRSWLRMCRCLKTRGRGHGGLQRADSKVFAGKIWAALDLAGGVRYTVHSILLHLIHFRIIARTLFWINSWSFLFNFLSHICPCFVYFRNLKRTHCFVNLNFWSVFEFAKVIWTKISCFQLSLHHHDYKG